MNTPKNIIQRVKNTLNEFKILNFYEVGEDDFNTEDIRNIEETVLIRIGKHETVIWLYNVSRIKDETAMYTKITIPHNAFKTFTGYMCVVFATVKEYYDRREVRNYHEICK